MASIDWQSMTEHDCFHRYHDDSEEEEVVAFMADLECASLSRYEAMVPARYADEDRFNHG